MAYIPFTEYRFDWQIAEAVVQGKRPFLPEAFLSLSSPFSSQLSYPSYQLKYLLYMRESWTSSPSQRPSFDVLNSRLSLLMKEIEN